MFAYLTECTHGNIPMLIIDQFFCLIICLTIDLVKSTVPSRFVSNTFFTFSFDEVTSNLLYVMPAEFTSMSMGLFAAAKEATNWLPHLSMSFASATLQIPYLAEVASPFLAVNSCKAATLARKLSSLRDTKVTSMLCCCETMTKLNHLTD